MLIPTSHAAARCTDFGSEGPVLRPVGDKVHAIRHELVAADQMSLKKRIFSCAIRTS
jgi:hypothetical protein